MTTKQKKCWNNYVKTLTPLNAFNGEDKSTPGHEVLASDSESARTCYHCASDEMGSITRITDEALKESSKKGEAKHGRIKKD